MKRPSKVILAALAVMALAATSAVAKPGAPANPQWQSANASLSSDGQTVSVAFKEVGLGSQYLTETITLSATVESTWGCFTKGPTSNHPQATNKEGPGTLSNSETFPVRNGQVTGTISLFIEAPDLCPNGQTERLIEASYTNITITGAAGPFLTTPSSLSFP
jgi:hypothetical protein